MDDFEYTPPESLSILLAGRHAARKHRGLDPDRLIRCLRKGAKLSQREVARRAGLRQARLSEIERGLAPARWPPGQDREVPLY
ncbi:MAG: helix-turn-helix transcriptional regulator [Elusimicrobia bacterium]|nr:helix-turn-helix transcriptional regulator [Elusimicrobiota bacterium]